MHHIDINGLDMNINTMPAATHITAATIFSMSIGRSVFFFFCYRMTFIMIIKLTRIDL